jgi:hypothetical protein
MSFQKQQFTIVNLMIQVLLGSNIVFGRIGATDAAGAVYSAIDDASWAVWNTTISDTILGSDRQRIYNEFMAGCRQAAGDSAEDLCDRDENFRLNMNMFQPRSVRTYYLKICQKTHPIIQEKLSMKLGDNNIYMH